MARALGRRTPKDFKHVEKYPLRIASAVESVERTLRLPRWHWDHDQGQEGACVGHGTAMERAIVNRQQAADRGDETPGVRYNPWWVWNEAKKIDEWDDTNPGDDNGTSVRAAYDVLRTQGLPFFRSDTPRTKAGIVANRWATTVDEMRTAISEGKAVTIGVTWYSNFDYPEDGWIGRGSLGRVRGGHSLCVYGASDQKQGFKLKNSWGRGYPLVWIPYDTMQTLLDDYGEATLVTDR